MSDIPKGAATRLRLALDCIENSCYDPPPAVVGAIGILRRAIAGLPVDRSLSAEARELAEAARLLRTKVAAGEIPDWPVLVEEIAAAEVRDEVVDYLVLADPDYVHELSPK